MRKRSETQAAMSLLELYASPGYLTRRAQQITMGLFAEEFDGWDVTAVQYVMLIAVNDRPGLDQRALMRLLAIDRSTIGTTLNVIEKRGLVERVTPKTNGRIKQLFMTDAGRALLEGTRSCFEAVQTAVPRAAGGKARGDLPAFSLAPCRCQQRGQPGASGRGNHPHIPRRRRAPRNGGWPAEITSPAARRPRQSRQKKQVMWSSHRQSPGRSWRVIGSRWMIEAGGLGAMV